MNWQTFFSDIAPSWLTALGTIGAVFAAVGQMIWYNWQKQQEDKDRSANARKFIDSLLTEHKEHFCECSNFAYTADEENLISNGNIQDLIRIFNRYIDNMLREHCVDYIEHMKFSIGSVGIQTDSHTIEELSVRLEKVNTVYSTLKSLSTLEYKHNNGKITDHMLESLFRNGLIKIDTALHILKQDLTDKDEE
ncbi:hypothetical protein [Mammaliicoccus sp. JADD-157]|uniref:hypothetical protein n=1 Tax=Mammaliicoccus sp. JADD-157 TaxID=3404818 RepID=UPI003BB75AF2